MIKLVKSQIKKFENAQRKLFLEEIQLNVLVQAEMQTRNDIASLMDLVYILPKNYKGRRKIYEQILRIDLGKA